MEKQGSVTKTKPNGDNEPEEEDDLAVCDPKDCAADNDETESRMKLIPDPKEESGYLDDGLFDDDGCSVFNVTAAAALGKCGLDTQVPARFSHTALVLSIVTLCCFAASVALFLLWHHYVGLQRSGNDNEEDAMIGHVAIWTSLALLVASAVAFFLAERRQCWDERRYQSYIEARRKKEEKEAEDAPDLPEMADKCIQVGTRPSPRNSAEYDGFTLTSF